jgi:hypothetical protein
MQKNSGLTAIAILVALCICIAFSSAYGITRDTYRTNHFKSIPPVILKTQDGRQYKFEIDVLQDSGQTTGEPYTYTNRHSTDALLKLIRGQGFTVKYGSPYGPIDAARLILLDGRVQVNDGPNGDVILNGKQLILLNQYAPSGNLKAQIPNNLKRGTYNLVILFTYNEELRGYYIIYTVVR